jgi:hypothetical protein
MLDRRNSVAYAVRKAIEIGNPEAKILEDKTVLEFAPTLPDGRRILPDLTFESAVKPRGKSTNTFHLVEIATHGRMRDKMEAHLLEPMTRRWRNTDRWLPTLSELVQGTQ